MNDQTDADRYADVKLNLTCPRCGSTGLVSLEQLDRMLFCFGCQQRYRVERQGLVEMSGNRVQVQVRTHLSDWQGHEAILESRSAAVGTWLVDRLIGFLTGGRARWAALALGVLAIGAWIAVANRAPVEKPPLEIPTALNLRAEMFSQALARRDMEVLIRLTDPAQHRALRIWLAHGSDVPGQVADAEPELPAKVVSTKTSPTGDRADLRVELSAGGKPILLDQQWVQRAGGGWYFQPIRVRSANILAGPAAPYTKQKRRS